MGAASLSEAVVGMVMPRLSARLSSLEVAVSMWA